MEKKIKPIVFPRYDEDIITQKRTLVHFESINGFIAADYIHPGDELQEVSQQAVGDTVVLCRKVLDKSGLGAKIVSVTQVKLSELSEEDCGKLNCSKEEYLERWNKLHPCAFVGNSDEKLIWRVEFEYTGSTIILFEVARKEAAHKENPSNVLN